MDPVTEEAAADETALISVRDVALVCYVAVMTPVAWLVPERLWAPLSRAVAATNGRIRPRRRRRLERSVASLFGTGPAETRRLVTDIRANIHVRHLQYLRMLRPGRWSPAIRIEGAERITDAAAQGRGVILWVAPLLFSDLVTKIAIARAGFRMSHLSLYVHGFASGTRFGLRVLNRLAARSEERFLAARYVMTSDRRREAIREIARRVRNGEVVSISAVVARGQRAITVPFLHDELRLAGGAPQLARRTGAVLLPVFTVRQHDGTFLTTVEEPILPPAADREEAVRSSVVAYAGRLERWIRQWPAQYPALVRGPRGADG